MRKLFVLIAALLAFNFAQAQGFFSWGIKAGGQSTNVKFKHPKLTDIILNGEVNARDFKLEQGDNNKWGFHAGAFVRIKVLAVYIQPELVFSHTSNEIVLSEINSASGFKDEIMSQKFNKFDIPVMVGMKFGPARVNLGPVASFTLSEGGKFRDKMKELTDESFDSELKKATFGGQVGVGVDILKKVSLDVRYEFPLSKFGDSIKIKGKEFATDQRNSQLVLSLGIFL